MSEVVIDGVTGKHTETFRDACDEVEKADQYDPKVIHNHIKNTYSIEAIAPQYDAYFRRIQDLHAVKKVGGGFFYL